MLLVLAVLVLLFLIRIFVSIKSITGKLQKIRYSSRSIKGLVILEILLLGMEAFCVWGIISQFNDLIYLIAISFVGVLAIFAIEVFFQLADGVMYLRALKKQGYEIPKRRSDYRGYLENMPCVENAKIPEVNKEGKSKQSIGLCVGSIVMGILFAGFGIFCRICFSHFDDPNATLIASMIFAVSYFAIGYVLYRQADNSKYKDVVVADTTRKNRVTVFEGIEMLFWYSVLALVVISVVTELSMYTIL